MSLVSDKASNRGSVAIYFRVPDYGTSWNHLGTVSLKSATNKNRVIVANIGGWSPQFDSCKGYEVKFKVASGRVDIDAVLLDETAYEYE